MERSGGLFILIPNNRYHPFFRAAFTNDLRCPIAHSRLVAVLLKVPFPSELPTTWQQFGQRTLELGIEHVLPRTAQTYSRGELEAFEANVTRATPIASTRSATPMRKI